MMAFKLKCDDCPSEVAIESAHPEKFLASLESVKIKEQWDFSTERARCPSCVKILGKLRGGALGG